MAIETKDQEIGGHKYTVTTFGGMEGVRVKAVLMKHLGPSFISLAAIGLASGKDEILDTDFDPSMVAGLFESLFTKMDENAYVKFILRLLSGTRRDNVELTEEVFNAQFAGEYGALYEVLFFVLEVNYKKSFFEGGGIGNLIKKIRNLVPPVKNFSKDSLSS